MIPTFSPPRDAAYQKEEEEGVRVKRLKKPALKEPTPSSQPRLEKIVLHSMSRDVVTNKAALLPILFTLQTITGIPALPLYARKDAAPWKLRRGQVVGAKVELTETAMYSFLDKLVHIVLPKMKDLEPLAARSGDGTGNLAFGLKSHNVGLFPEIEQVYERYPKVHGLDMVMVTSAQNNEEARLLLSGFGFPVKPRRPRPAPPPPSSSSVVDNDDAAVGEVEVKIT